MVLAAADSTLEGMLSLNVNVIEEGADDSSSQSCALVMVGGAGAVHHDDMRSSHLGGASRLSTELRVPLVRGLKNLNLRTTSGCSLVISGSKLAAIGRRSAICRQV